MVFLLIIIEINRKKLEALDDIEDEETSEIDSGKSSLEKEIKELEEKLKKLENDEIYIEYNEAFKIKNELTSELKKWKQDYKKEHGEDMPKEVLVTRESDFRKVKESQAKVKSLKNEAEKVEKDIEITKEELELKRKQLGESGGDNEVPHPETVVDNSKMKELKGLLKESLLKEKDYLNQIHNLEDKVNENERELSNLKNTNEQLRYDYENIQQQLSNNTPVDTSEYTDKIDLLNDEISEYKHKIDDLESKISDLEYKLEQSTSTSVGVAVSVKGSSNTNSAELNKLKRDLEASNRKLTDANDQIEKIKKELTDSKKQLKELQAVY